MKSHTQRPSRSRGAGILLALICFSSDAHAALRVWSGGATMSNSWTNAPNWSTGVAPATGDDLQFPFDASKVNSNDNYTNGTTFNSIQFLHGGTPTPNHSYNLTGNSIALNAGVSAVNNYPSGWANSVSNPFLLNSNQTFSTGPYTSLDFKGPIDLNGNDLTFDAAGSALIDAPIDVHAVISGLGNLIKTNGGTLTLWSNNTYTGSTTLTGGTLQIDGSQPASPVLLNLGTLTGKGTVGTITSIGNSGPGSIVLNPSGTVSVLTCSNASLNAATTFIAALNGPSAGGYNQLNVHGSVALNNATLSVSLGFSPAIGESFIIIANDGADPVNGTFSGLPEGALFSAGGLYFRITYAGFDGNDVVLTRASVLTVTNTADSGTGSLRAALLAATNGDTINFAGNVIGTITLLSGELPVNQSVSILGPGAAVLAVDGNHAGRVFHFNTMTGSISGLTITNGYTIGSPPSGGAGGGIFSEHSTLTVSNCMLSGNSSAFVGGGICNYGASGSALTVVASTITSNWCGSGGGGGLCNYLATSTVLASTVSSNSANPSYGGGIYNYGQGGSATLSVSNSTFSGNSSQYGGGGIYNYGQGGSATLSVIACTFSGNSGTVGGAIDNDRVSTGTSTLEIGDTLLKAGPSGGTLYNNGTFISDGYNLSSDNGGFVLNNATDRTNTEPLLGPLQNNGGLTLTHALLPGSPAIDGGRGFGLSTDQRGVPRPLGSPAVGGGDGSDIGAFEFTPPPRFVSIAALANSIQLQGTGISNFTYTIQAATNLNPVIQWTNIGASTVNSNGVFSLTDTNSALFPLRFYRAVWP